MCSAKPPQPQPGLDHRFARLQAQFPAYVIHLGELRLFESGVLVRKVCAGIEHPLIQPEFVEFVANVVMVMDVAARTAQGVSSCDRGQQRVDPVLAGQRPDTIDGLETIQQVTLHFDTLGGIQLAEVQFRVRDQPEQRTAVANQDARHRIAARARYCLPIPQHNIDRRIAKHLQRFRHQKFFQRKATVAGCAMHCIGRCPGSQRVIVHAASRIFRRSGLFLAHVFAP